MTDVLSVAAGTTGLISFGIRVTEYLVNFYSAYKHQEAEVARTTEKLQHLLDIFRILSATLENRRDDDDKQEDLIKNVIEPSIYQCAELIQELREECGKLYQASNGGHDLKAAIKVTGHRTAYPFRRSTLHMFQEHVNDVRGNLSLALDALKLRDRQTVHDDVADLKSLLELVRASQVSSTIHEWLKAPDPTINHNAACAQRHPGTGDWFVKGAIFRNWLVQNDSFLWLNGPAGCGKSVLCSTAVQHTFRHKRSDPRVGIAFFYFTFNDESKRDESGMVRALLLQLSGQLSHSEADLLGLRNSYKPGVPPPAILMAHLQHMIRRFDQVYILLDALDESPRYDQRDQVLDAIETMRRWLWPGLHLLVTSRDAPDIRGSLNPVVDEEMILKNDEINKDISDFISGHLRTDRQLRKLDRYHDQIQQALTKGAQGIFRWVECQFKSLKQCQKSEKRITGCLRSLPRGLDETYERMLCNIDEDSIHDARRILTLLCFSSRPLTVRELIDAIAVELDEPAGLDVSNRMQDVDDILSICPGLIDIDVMEDDETYILRIAHFSVQEYLESDRIMRQKPSSFALQSSSAHAEIAQICLIYLQEPGLSSSMLDETKLEEYPFAHFAALFWYAHYRNASAATPQLDGLVLKLFLHPLDSFHAWVKLHDPDKPWNKMPHFSLTPSQIASPIYYASLLGLDGVLSELIRIRQVATDRMALTDDQGGGYGNPLLAASVFGHDRVVQILINAGAEVNAQNEIYGNALHAASWGGHDKTVQILIDAGAEINTQGGKFGNALIAASWEGRDEVVQILIDAGAKINIQNEEYGTALQAASKKGYDKIVQKLIDAGAEINTQDEHFGDALLTASREGHDTVAQRLIDAGADVDAQNEMHGNALQVASAEGRDKVVQMLIDAGAEVDAQGGEYGNALLAASWRGHDKVVQILINAGAGVNTQYGDYGSPLLAASAQGHDKIIQMLMDAGAEINLQGGKFGNALLAASSRGHDTVAQTLINAGAEVNTQYGDYGSPLSAASARNHDKIVLSLIKAGADINAQNEEFGNPLQEASSRGFDKVVQVLIDARAKINAQGGYYGNALQAASAEGRDKVVQMLIDAGAEVDLQGGRYGNALLAASARGHDRVVQILISAGAKINAQDEYHGNALQEASIRRYDRIVQMLLNAGAVRSED